MIAVWPYLRAPPTTSGQAGLEHLGSAAATRCIKAQALFDPSHHRSTTARAPFTPRRKRPCPTSGPTPMESRPYHPGPIRSAATPRSWGSARQTVFNYSVTCVLLPSQGHQRCHSGAASLGLPGRFYAELPRRRHRLAGGCNDISATTRPGQQRSLLLGQHRALRSLAEVAARQRQPERLHARPQAALAAAGVLGPTSPALRPSLTSFAAARSRS
jgi:hypothetical protein